MRDPFFEDLALLRDNDSGPRQFEQLKYRRVSFPDDPPFKVKKLPENPSVQWDPRGSMDLSHVHPKGKRLIALMWARFAAEKMADQDLITLREVLFEGEIKCRIMVNEIIEPLPYLLCQTKRLFAGWLAFGALFMVKIG